MGNTNTTTPYSLRWPEAGDLADVPTDMRELATDVATELANKISQTQANGLYQKKITVQTTAPAPGDPGTEGDIIFVVP